VLRGSRATIREGIGFLNDLFYGRSYSAGPGELSIRFVFDENSNAAPADVDVVAVRTRAKDSLWRRAWGSVPQAIVFRHADQKPLFIRCHVVSLIQTTWALCECGQDPNLSSATSRKPWRRLRPSASRGHSRLGGR